MESLSMELMRTRWAFVLAVSVLTTSAGCAGDEEDAPRRALESLDTQPATPSVEMVGPGTVSSDLPEFAATLSSDGDTIWFNRTPPDRSRLDLYVAAKSDAGWGEARPFPPTVGLVAVDPFLSSDGRRLFFSSTGTASLSDTSVFSIWSVEREGDGWSRPVEVAGGLNSSTDDVFNSMSDDGEMVLSSRRDGERLIYRTRERDGSWEQPTPLPLGPPNLISNPAISRDGTLLVVAIREAEGEPDLFVSCRTSGSWTEPVRLPEPINSSWADFAPGWSHSHFYFSSERPGIVGAVADSIRPPGDIYRAPIAAVASLCGETAGSAGR